MGSSNSLKVLSLLIVLGVLGSTLGVVRTAAVPFKMIQVEESVSGSGSAGSGSLAVAVFFSVSDSKGAGAFSGTLTDRAFTQEKDAIFSLNTETSPLIPVLQCGPAPEVEATGTVISGSFLGEQVLVASCIGTGVPGAFIIYHSTPSNPDFSGQGTGTAAVLSGSFKGGIAAAGVTSGSGSTGSGTIYTAEANGITKDGTLIGGGAFVGTISDHPVGTTWVTNRASVQSGCTLTTSGVAASFGSFPNQPVSSSYTLVTCPPASSGSQTARFVYVIGGDTSPIYKGTGSALIELFAFLAER